MWTLKHFFLITVILTYSITAFIAHLHARTHAHTLAPVSFENITSAT